MVQNKKVLFILFVFFVFGMGNLFAGDIPKKEKKLTPQGLYLTAKEAYQMVKEQDQILFIDVRTRPELEFVGWTNLVNANIPFQIKDFSAWNTKKTIFQSTTNSDFLRSLKKLLEQNNLGKNSKIILICRSGCRSAVAARKLYTSGYKNIYSVVDGFEGDKDASGRRSVNGWKNAGLPWSYKLKKEKMYGLISL